MALSYYEYLATSGSFTNSTGEFIFIYDNLSTVTLTDPQGNTLQTTRGGSRAGRA